MFDTKNRIRFKIRFKARPKTKTKNGPHKLAKELGEYVEVPWDVIGAYFKGSHLCQTVRHQLSPTTTLSTTKFETIEMFNPVRIGPASVTSTRKLVNTP